MARKKFSTFPKNELLNMRDEKRKALRDFRFAITGSRAKNVKEARTIRRDIARIETALTTLRTKEKTIA